MTIVHIQKQNPEIKIFILTVAANCCKLKHIKIKKFSKQANKTQIQIVCINRRRKGDSL